MADPSATTSGSNKKTATSNPVVSISSANGMVPPSVPTPSPISPSAPVYQPTNPAQQPFTPTNPNPPAPTNASQGQGIMGTAITGIGNAISSGLGSLGNLISPKQQEPSVISPNIQVPVGASSGMTGATTNQGAYNPTTGGYETVNPSTGVNTGVYSPDEKQKAWEKSGRTGSYDPNAFSRGANGELTIKDGTTISASSPDLKTTMPGGAGQVETGGTTETPLTGNVNSDAQALIDQMFPKGQYTNEERAAILEGLTSSDKKLWADNTAAGAEARKALAKSTLDAWRLDRDAKAKLAREKELNDRRAADAIQSYDNAIRDQKMKMEADANNNAMALGNSGRLRSRNAMNNISELFARNQEIYSQLVANKGRDLQRLGEDFKFAQTSISNEYNDKVSSNMEDILKNIQGMNSTGTLDTAEGLLLGRSYIQKTLEANLSHQEDYYNKLKYISDRFDVYHKEQVAEKVVDETQTQLHPDGFLYNANGNRVLKDDGKPMMVSDSSGKYTSTFEGQDGKQYAVFSVPGKKPRIEEIYAAPDLTEDQKTAIKAMIASKVPVDTIAKSFGLTGSQLLQAVSGVTEFPYESAVSDKLNTVASKGFSQVKRTVTDEYGNPTEIIGTMNENNGQITWQDGSTSGGAVSDIDPNGIAQYSISQRGTKNLQCGQLVNDYWKMTTGSSAGMGDTVESKARAVMDIGPSETPVVGGLFVSDPLSNGVGHTGIVQSVNADGSISVLEANAQGKDSGQPPVIKTYSASQLKGMMFSQAPSAKTEDIPSLKKGAGTIGASVGGMGTAGGYDVLDTGLNESNNYGLSNENDVSTAKKWASGGIKMTEIKQKYPKAGSTFFSKLENAKNAIASQKNMELLEEQGIDPTKIPKSQFDKIITMDSSALNDAIDISRYKASFNLATARSTTGDNRITLYDAAKNLTEAQGLRGGELKESGYGFLTDWETGSTKWGDRSQRNSFNKAINHLTGVYDSSLNLDNTSWGWINKGSQWASQNITGNQEVQKNIKKFDTEKQLALTEVGTMVKAGVLDKKESADLVDSLNAASTPGEVEGAVSGLMQLISGRIDTLSNNYVSNIGELPKDMYTEQSYNNWKKLQKAGIIDIDPDVYGGYLGQELLNQY